MPDGSSFQMETAPSAPSLPTGIRVVICGLTKRPELNGAFGCVVGYCEERDRFATELEASEDGEQVLLKAECLKATSTNTARDSRSMYLPRCLCQPFVDGGAGVDPHRLPNAISTWFAAGGDINARSARCGRTLLMLFSGCGLWKMATWALEVGADVSLEDSDGRTALQLAVSLAGGAASARNMGRLLLEAGACLPSAAEGRSGGLVGATEPSEAQRQAVTELGDLVRAEEQWRARTYLRRSEAAVVEGGKEGREGGENHGRTPWPQKTPGWSIIGLRQLLYRHLKQSHSEKVAARYEFSGMAAELICALLDGILNALIAPLVTPNAQAATPAHTNAGSSAGSSAAASGIGSSSADASAIADAAAPAPAADATPPAAPSAAASAPAQTSAVSAAITRHLSTEFVALRVRVLTHGELCRCVAAVNTPSATRAYPSRQQPTRPPDPDHQTPDVRFSPCAWHVRHSLAIEEGERRLKEWVGSSMGVCSTSLFVVGVARKLQLLIAQSANPAVTYDRGLPAYMCASGSGGTIARSQARTRCIDAAR